MINYRHVSKAIKCYVEHFGYTYIDTPWIVRDEVIDVTLPPGRRGFTLAHPAINSGKLVGSAEQGFLQLILDGSIQPGKYVSAGPCFRDEPIVDEHHQLSFFKVELIHWDRKPTKLDGETVKDVALEASNVISRLYACPPSLVKTDAGYDLELDGVEVGSYGLRSHANFEWVYGTGLALPRTSDVVERRFRRTF